MNNIFPFKSGYVMPRVTRSLLENGALPDLSKSITRSLPFWQLRITRSYAHISILSCSRYIRKQAVK